MLFSNGCHKTFKQSVFSTVDNNLQLEFGTSTAMDTQLETFNEHRPLLFGIAWRMLGNAADAEDILQDAYIRWQGTIESDVRSPRALLVTIVTRLCLNHLNLAHVKREQSFGTEFALESLPSSDANPADDADLADALDAAFSIVLTRLSPVERAVFLLREVFDRNYSEVARIVEKSEDNCRQILRRARERLAGQESRFDVSLQQQESVLREFLNATSSGDVERLAQVLAGESTLVSDGANLGAAPPPPIHGASAISRYLINRSRDLLPSEITVRTTSLGQVPLVLMYSGGNLQNALAFVLRHGRIQTIYRITCPVRLRSLAAQSST
jgi:RNA polymerase sigma-70 factor (ECF subfamily)